MKIRQAISELRGLKPNQYSDGTLLRWLSELDGQIYEDVLQYSEDAPSPPRLPYEVEKDMDTELLAAFPHEGMYISYLAMKIDFQNGEYDRYNNDMAMYTMAYQAFCDSWNRTHMHRQDGVIHV